MRILATIFTAAIMLTGCSDDDPSEPDAGTSPEAEKSTGTTTPDATAERPTPGSASTLHIARVVRTSPADDGCMDEVDQDWKPDGSRTTMLCGVENGTETRYRIRADSAFEAQLQNAEVADPSVTGGSTWGVAITFEQATAEKFQILASKLLTAAGSDRIALIVDGKVVMAPAPMQGIENLTQVQITGDFDEDRAESLARALS